ncbi:MAG: hypothetical protein K0R54_547 [Clostridiaceae bacterium]|jgi:hypothetical protein|nr:hypothetical protein [Clostridiaceae bacterium]
MDIVVTIPKFEYENDIKENEDIVDKRYDAFWTLSKIPKNLNIGDRVYFVKNNQISSSMKVVEIKEDSTSLCETTNRVWSGKCQIIMDDFREESILDIKGFQSFRYKWW